ncbi:hypothetical protein MTP99_017557 [Tenebrio molitor]|nr:hypothetical protein MTP99_017557 [Tenebrio molitor]
MSDPHKHILVMHRKCIFLITFITSDRANYKNRPINKNLASKVGPPKADVFFAVPSPRAVASVVLGPFKLTQDTSPIKSDTMLESSDHDDAFITESSYDLLKTGNFERVPYVVRFNSEK